MSIPVDSRRAFEERLQTLQREYRAHLPKTVAALEDEVRALGAGSTSERWTNIMGLAHRIIGAATTFGHPGLGRAGRQIQSLAERRRLAPQCHICGRRRGSLYCRALCVPGWHPAGTGSVDPLAAERSGRG